MGTSIDFWSLIHYLLLPLKGAKSGTPEYMALARIYDVVDREMRALGR